MAEYDQTRKVTDPADPRRCQAMSAKMGQCTFVSLEGGTLCFRHERNPKRLETKKLNNYLLGQYYTRAAEMASGSDVKTLTDEIGLLRMLLERTLDPIKTDADLMVAMPQISDLISRIEKIVLTSHKLEMQMGTLMGREEIVIIANQMVNIIAANVEDERIVKIIADEIGEKLESKVLSLD